MNDDAHRPRHLAGSRPPEPDEPPVESSRDGSGSTEDDDGEPAHPQRTSSDRRAPGDGGASDESGRRSDAGPPGPGDSGERSPEPTEAHREEQADHEERAHRDERAHRETGPDRTAGGTAWTEPARGEVRSDRTGNARRDRPDRGDDHAGDVGSGPAPVGYAPWRAWALPALLAVVSVVASISALVVDRDVDATPIGAPSSGTPVLSARRAPELLAAPVANRRLRADLDAWLASSPPDTCLAVEVAGDPVYEHRTDAPLTGASTHKLLTATGLLLTLGPDAQLETRALAASAPTDGVVAGDLHLVGGGDALLATPAWRDHFTRQPRTINDIDQLAQAIAGAGISRIEGGVVGDGSRYDDEMYHPVWPRRFFDQDAVGPIGGLVVNDGFAAFPPQGEGNAETIPADDPAQDAARVLTERLEAAGVDVAGSPRSGATPDSAVEVAALASPTIAEVATQMLVESDNETSEMALKELGLIAAGDGSWTAGAAALTDLLDGAGIALDGVRIIDGSGLSIENQLTCDTLVDVLTLPATGALLRDGLPVAGRTGTLADRWTGTAVEGRLRAKTGSLRNVTSLAGEVDADGGDTLRFAYVANVADPGTIDPAAVDQAGLAGILAGYPHDLDVEALGPAVGAPPESQAPPPG